VTLGVDRAPRTLSSWSRSSARDRLDHALDQVGWNGRSRRGRVGRPPVGEQPLVADVQSGPCLVVDPTGARRAGPVTIHETGEQIAKTAADQIAVIGTLSSGATASIHLREAVAGGTGFLWEINGTDGTLRMTADAAVPGIFPLTVAGARGRNEPAELAVPAALAQKWPELASLEGTPADNVGRAYAGFAADIDNRTHTVPDFADAVRRHQVIAAIERSAAAGERVNAGPAAPSRGSLSFCSRWSRAIDLAPSGLQGVMSLDTSCAR
jgi:hypothetical protein